jgi:exonuclease III
MQPGIDDQSLINVGELIEPSHYNDSSKINHCDVNKIPYHRGMVMTTLDINSLIAHIDEFRAYININKIDIMCINETTLDSSVKDHEVCLPGYQIIRRDRSVNGRNGGGICIYFRANINYKIRDDLHLEVLENLVLEINKPRSKPILVSTWYRPPDSPVSHFT